MSESGASPQDPRARGTQRTKSRISGIPIRRLGALSLAVAAALALVWFGARDDSGQPVIVDTALYFEYADRMAKGELPYRDFEIEYPPHALGPIALPALAAEDMLGYAAAHRALMGIMLAASVLATMAAAMVSGRASATLGAGALVAVGPGLLGWDLVGGRYDLWPVLLVTLALLALVTRREQAGSALIGLGTAAKLWPLFVLPAALGVAFRRHGWAGIGWSMTAFALGAGLPLTLGLLVSPTGMWQTLSEQAGRGLQVETLGSSILLGLSQLGLGGPYMPSNSRGSQTLVGGGVQAVLAASSTLLLGLVLLAGTLGLREVLRARDAQNARETGVRYAFAAVVAFMLFGRVLSPQFLLWLLPFPFLIERSRRWPAAGLVVASLVLTNDAVRDYGRYAFDLSPGPTAVVLTRNLLLVGLLALLMAPKRQRGYRWTEVPDSFEEAEEVALRRPPLGRALSRRSLRPSRLAAPLLVALLTALGLRLIGFLNASLLIETYPENLLSLLQEVVLPGALVAGVLILCLWLVFSLAARGEADSPSPSGG